MSEVREKLDTLALAVHDAFVDQIVYPDNRLNKLIEVHNWAIDQEDEQCQRYVRQCRELLADFSGWVELPDGKLKKQITIKLTYGDGTVSTQQVEYTIEEVRDDYANKWRCGPVKSLASKVVKVEQISEYSFGLDYVDPLPEWMQGCT